MGTTGHGSSPTSLAALMTLAIPRIRISGLRSTRREDRRELAAGKRKTFAALIIEYKDSDAYKLVLGEGSKEGYDIYLEDIRVALGSEVVAAFTPVNAQAAIDAYKDGPVPHATSGSALAADLLGYPARL